MTNTRKKVLMALTLLFGIVVFGVMIYMLQEKNSIPNSDLVPVLDEETEMSAQEQQYRDENVSLFEDTVSPEDDVIKIEQRIDVTNMDIMAERGYSQESIDALIPYLDAYFDYYDPDGGNYTAEIGATAGNKEEYPHFLLLVDMNGTDFWINCIYFPSDKEYVFYSDFGDPFDE